MPIDIRIDYRLNGSAELLRKRFSPEAYFDLDPGETPEVDSVPQRNNAIEYLEGISRRDVEFTRLQIHDNVAGKTRVVTTTYWNDGENGIAEVSESSGGVQDYWELILDSLVSSSPRVNEILRVGREAGIIKIYMHDFIETRADGTERERMIFPPQSETD
jgi:hypothetical protein